MRKLVHVQFFLELKQVPLHPYSSASELQATEAQIQVANSVVSNPSAVSNSSKVTKQVINALLAPAKALSELLALVSEAVPPTQPVAELFRVRCSFMASFNGMPIMVWP